MTAIIFISSGCILIQFNCTPIGEHSLCSRRPLIRFLTFTTQVAIRLDLYTLQQCNSIYKLYFPRCSTLVLHKISQQYKYTGSILLIPVLLLERLNSYKDKLLFLFPYKRALCTIMPATAHIA